MEWSGESARGGNPLLQVREGYAVLEASGGVVDAVQAAVQVRVTVRVGVFLG